MHESAHVRAISLVLAFSVVVGGWLAFEYSNRQAEQIPQRSVASQEPGHQALQASQATKSAPMQRPLSIIPEHLAITYKCEKAGRISFSDRACASNERTVSITASEKEIPTANNLQQLKGRLAAMEEDRRERENKFAVAAIATSLPATSTSQVKEQRCQQIDLEIAAKDSQLRQPHDAQWGDYLTGERKKLTDERFSLRC